MSILKNIVINAQETIGNKLLLLEVKPYYAYSEGIKGNQDGLTFIVLSEKMAFEKIDIKVSGLLKPPFDFDGTPIAVTFENASARLWQDWNNKGAVKISFTATDIKPLNTQKIKIGGEK